MDVLKPELIWVGGRCYRLNPLQDDEDNGNMRQKSNTYVEEGEDLFKNFI